MTTSALVISLGVVGLLVVVAVWLLCLHLQAAYDATHRLPIDQTDCWLPFVPAPWTEGC